MLTIEFASFNTCHFLTLHLFDLSMHKNLNKQKQNSFWDKSVFYIYKFIPSNGTEP